MSDAKSKKQNKLLLKILYIALLVILALIFLFSAGMLIRYFIDSQESQQTYDELKGLAGDYTRPAPATQPAATGEATEPPTEATSPLVTVTDPNTGAQVQVLPQFAELYPLNTDLVGWISIPDTNVDYPVVQRPAQKDYYLYRDFYGKYDSHGCIYAREVCDINAPSDNITIYGHRMQDKTMFADLALLQKKSFWEEHPYIYFDTLTEYHTYEIVYVLTTSASVGSGFAYHEYVDFADEEDFNSFTTKCARYSLFETGVTPEFGDQFITLSTCEYTHENGRLVIVARRMD